MIIKLLPSHPDYKKFSILQESIHVAINAHAYFNGYISMDENIEPGKRVLELSESELLDLKNCLFSEMEELISNYEYLPPEIAKLMNEIESDDDNYDGDIDLTIFGLVE